ncbi:hypothetical protein ACO0M4_03450 [Streptomyces sp. RGM 3693]|uniref:hypothetical protein n=1 Tax=Streptomyces sp. RGM 3693 TaxID=3413284 RepID=UPI003D2B46AD
MGTTTDKRTDDATTDDVKTDTVQADDVKTDAAKVDAAKVDAAKVDAVKSGAATKGATDGTEETGKIDETGKAGETATKGEAAKGESRSGAESDAVSDAEPDAESDAKSDAEYDAEYDVDEDAPEEPAPAAPSGAAAGAGAVVAAGLGLASVTGTWLSTLLAERQTLLGQIKLQSGKATDQIAAVYGAPWHTTALVNGVFAVLAMLVAAVVLTGRRPTWVRAVAWGGLVLGLLGLIISAGMYLDLFASMPSIPKAPGGGA